jgi:hypothetical protein
VMKQIGSQPGFPTSATASVSRSRLRKELVMFGAFLTMLVVGEVLRTRAGTECCTEDTKRFHVSHG